MKRNIRNPTKRHWALNFVSLAAGICKDNVVLFWKIAHALRSKAASVLRYLTVLSLFFVHFFPFIVVKYTSHKTYHWNHLSVYNSVTLSTFTMLYDHPYYPFLERFHHAPKKLCGPSTITLHHPRPSTLGSDHSTFCLHESVYSRYFM